MIQTPQEEIAYIMEVLREIHGSTEKAAAWITLPNIRLGGKKPAELMHFPESAKIVRYYVNSIWWDLRHQRNPNR